MIELQEVTKCYGNGPGRVEALAGVSLRVESGQFVSVMGKSGSGKSTLLNLVSALDNPTSGRVLIDGQDTSNLDDDALTLFRRRKIGLIFQFFNLLPTLDALDNVLLAAMIERQITSADRARGLELLAEVGLASRVNHGIHELSGGEMQRVAVARALMLKPRLVLADEPTGNLDSTTAEQVLELLKRSCEHSGTSLIMVTHDPHAAAFGDRIVALKDGRIVNDVRTRELTTQSAAQ